MKKKTFIVVAPAVLLFGLGIALFCRWYIAYQSGPEETLNAFFVALRQNDFKSARKMMSNRAAGDLDRTLDKGESLFWRAKKWHLDSKTSWLALSRWARETDVEKAEWRSYNASGSIWYPDFRDDDPVTFHFSRKWTGDWQIEFVVFTMY